MTAKIVNVVLVGKSKSRKSRKRANDTVDESSEEFAHRAFHIDCHKL